MAHVQYQTEGLILKTRAFGEKDLLVSVFTKEFGNILAKVKSVRSIESKMRFHLEVGRLVELNLIKTRDHFRVIGVDTLSEFYRLNRDDFTRTSIEGLVKILSRMIIGEEKEEEIFNDIKNFFFLLHLADELNEIERREFIHLSEIIAISRIMSRLGYLKSEINFVNILSLNLDQDLVYKTSDNKKELIKRINEAILSSGL